jgi:hypothetical protein
MIICYASSLKMFYKKICWEKIHENCFVLVGPPGLRGAKHRGIYLRHGLQINTYHLILYRDIQKWVGYWFLRPVWISNKKWRQNLDFEWSEKGIFWETQKSTLLENPISKPFWKVGFLKFCRHFCLHSIHEWNWFCWKWYQQTEG